MEPLQAETTIIFETGEVTQALAGMGLKEGDLQKAALYGMRYALQCTLHDPPMLPGITAWGKTIRSLRDQLVPLGWQPDNTKNYATIVDPKKNIALAASAGDANTGKNGLNQNPSTRNPKGSETKKAINKNQLHFSQISDSFPKPQQSEGVETWLLLYYWDEEHEEIRVELSLPRDMDLQGYVKQWTTRVILSAVPLAGATKQDIPTDDTGPIEVDVQELG